MKGVTVERITNQGISFYKIRDWVCYYIANEIQPSRVFEIGCGIGLYGGCLHLLDDTIEMIGLDAYMPYLLQEFVQKHYATTIHGRAEDLIGGCLVVKADLTLCMDMIEHLEKPTAVALLDSIHGHVIISTPLFDYKQEAVNGNEDERHRCWFEQKELNAMGFRTLRIENMSDDGESEPIGAFERKG